MECLTRAGTGIRHTSIGNREIRGSRVPRTTTLTAATQTRPVGLAAKPARSKDTLPRWIDADLTRGGRTRRPTRPPAEGGSKRPVPYDGDYESTRGDSPVLDAPHRADASGSHQRTGGRRGHGGRHGPMGIRGARYRGETSV